jgi:hypothetical protein
MVDINHLQLIFKGQTTYDYLDNLSLLRVIVNELLTLSKVSLNSQKNSGEMKMKFKVLIEILLKSCRATKSKSLPPIKWAFLNRSGFGFIWFVLIWVFLNFQLAKSGQFTVEKSIWIAKRDRYNGADANASIQPEFSVFSTQKLRHRYKLLLPLTSINKTTSEVASIFKIRNINLFYFFRLLLKKFYSII